MDLEELANHVCDTKFFHFPWGHAHLGTVFGIELTKFMVLEVIAVLLMILMFVGLARRIRSGAAAKGFFWNALEVLVVFIRDDVARPAIGRHDADKFLPLLWNLFFFIVLCNLLGAVPWAGSPTAALPVTLALALITFGTVLATGMMKFGPGRYWLTLIPHMDLSPRMKIVMLPMIFVIEVFGLFIRHTVLAVRLLANMFGGHLVIAVIVSFIVATAQLFIVVWAGVAVTSLAAAAALTLLEIFFAFLQAYIFTFLAALFIGMSAHPH
jgi:F-type H+-transporting ATPase subunit a